MEAVRVGFDTGPLYGPKSGVGFSVEALHRALAERSDVQLVDYLVSFRARPEPAVRRLPIPAAVAHRCWAHTGHPRADRWLQGVQVVHGTNYVVPPVRLPRLVTVHDCWFLRSPHQASAAVNRAGAVMRRAIANGAAVHAVSHATADAVRELVPGARVHVVPWGALPLPPPPVAAPIPDLVGRRFIVAIGTLERRKNLPTLVRAFGRLAADRPDLDLVLAGRDGDDRTAIDAAVDALGSASTRVLFAGRVDEGTRSWLLHHASVLAYPSLDEGFGFPLLDAMQAGVPVVASDAGAIPEVAGNAALLGPALDVDALTANLAEALDDHDTRRRLVAAGHGRRQQFSWDRCAQEMAALYRRLAEDSS
ncbi:MAG: glycosyltransferase family 1 protein [Actinomycetota bacterium]|nr:glycosyltransferase family 1 protein [Actinomycetota bacterium]